MGQKAKLAGKGTKRKPLSGLKQAVAKKGGHDAYRAHVGYLPSGYHQNPTKYKLTADQKIRVRRMHRDLNERTFERIYGFSK